MFILVRLVLVGMCGDELPESEIEQTHEVEGSAKPVLSRLHRFALLLSGPTLAGERGGDVADDDEDDRGHADGNQEPLGPNRSVRVVLDLRHPCDVVVHGVSFRFL